jgi:hypothetical protein
MVMIVLIIINSTMKFLLILSSILVQITPSIPQIHNPRNGDILQGVIAILGSTDLAGYDHHQISFNYSDSPGDTWFSIAKSVNMVSDGELANWDTTTIADGNYKIRLEVFLNDGSSREILVDGLRVRNYSPVETQSNTTLLLDGEGILETDTNTSVIVIPDNDHEKAKNPLTVSMKEFYQSMACGAGLTITFFLFLFIYSAFRKISK